MNLEKFLIPSRALYYPTIKIQDINLIKLNLLYFDAIQRIVPSELAREIEDEETGSRDIRSLIESDLLSNIDPSLYIQEAEQKFIEKIIPILERPEDAVILITGDKTSSIHIEKMTYNLREKLIRLKIAKKVGDWIKTPSGIGQIYMTSLASVTGEKIRSSLITERESQHDLAKYLSFGNSASAVKDQDSENKFLSVLGQLKVPFASYEAVQHTELEKVISFSEKHRDERRRFRATIEAIADFMRTEIEDPNQLQVYLAEQKKDIEAAMEDYHRVFEELLPDQSLSGLVQTVTLDTPMIRLATATLGATLVSPAFGLVVGVGAISLTIGLRGWQASHELNQRAALSDTPEDYLPWHYLAKVNQEFPAPSPDFTQI